MSEARLSPGIWIKAQQRICDQNGLPFAVVRRGDMHGGTVIVKVVAPGSLADLLVQATGPDGGLAWRRPLGDQSIPEMEADRYIDRQAKFDPDVWAIEIIDPQGKFRLDEPIID